MELGLGVRLVVAYIVAVVVVVQVRMEVPPCNRGTFAEWCLYGLATSAIAQRLRLGSFQFTTTRTSSGLSMFGTVNLDMRSLWLNYEVALFVYDPEFAKELRALQQTYIDDADRLDPAQWSTRPFHERFLENALRLTSPLL